MKYNIYQSKGRSPNVGNKLSQLNTLWAFEQLLCMDNLWSLTGIMQAEQNLEASSDFWQINEKLKNKV